MQFRILSLFAAVLLVAACQTKPTTTAVSGGEGAGGASAHSGAQGDDGVMVGNAIPDADDAAGAAVNAAIRGGGGCAETST